jgi:hypothetical protein
MLARRFADLGKFDDFEIQRCQHIERLLTGGIREFSPSEPGIEERSLGVGYLAHGHLLGREILVPRSCLAAGGIYKSCA